MVAHFLNKIGRLLSVGQLFEGVDAAQPRGRVLELFLREIPAVIGPHFRGATRHAKRAATSGAAECTATVRLI